jgi:hypothetical protein
MLTFNYDYQTCIKNSERVAWRLDDVMPEGTKLDLTRPLLPGSLAAARVACLSPREQLVLNQLGGNAYLNLFAFVEEFILATVVQHAQAEMFGDHDVIRALVRFADEEIKHQQLFERYRRAFDASFGQPAKVLETAAEVAGVVLGKSPIGVMVIILHIELMTQDHYTQSVKDDTAIDAFFAKLLEKHWLEESQHARVDALELARLVNVATPEQITQGVTDYCDLLGAFDGLLGMQAQMDLETLGASVCREFPSDQAAAIVAAQHAAYRRTFLVAGIRNPQFFGVITKLGGGPEVAALAERWSAA